MTPTRSTTLTAYWKLPDLSLSVRDVIESSSAELAAYLTHAGIVPTAEPVWRVFVRASVPGGRLDELILHVAIEIEHAADRPLQEAQS